MKHSVAHKFGDMHGWHPKFDASVVTAMDKLWIVFMSVRLLEMFLVSGPAGLGVSVS